MCTCQWIQFMLQSKTANIKGIGRMEGKLDLPIDFLLGEHDTGGVHWNRLVRWSLMWCTDRSTAQCKDHRPKGWQHESKGHHHLTGLDVGVRVSPRSESVHRDSSPNCIHFLENPMYTFNSNLDSLRFSESDTLNSMHRRWTPFGRRIFRFTNVWPSSQLAYYNETVNFAFGGHGFYYIRPKLQASEVYPNKPILRRKSLPTERKKIKNQ